MRFTVKKLIFICLLIFHSSFMLGCQGERYDDTKNTTPVDTMEIDSGETQENESASKPEDTVSAMGTQEKSVIREYKWYIMNQGSEAGTKVVQEYIGQRVELTDTYQKILEELNHYLGYEIGINEITVSADQISIDLKESSDLFHKEKYNVLLTEPIHYQNYEDMAFGLLDSMMMTMRENHGFEIEVLFTEDGKEMTLPDLPIEADFPLEEPYQGSDYYISNYLARSEGSITSIVDLGMSFNETIIKLKEEEIPYTETENFSMLGDRGSWETCDNVNEYLRNAWIHIDLSSDAYQFVFDGPNTVLMGITITKKDLPSSRGLLLGDSYTRMVELYGDAYTMYVMEGSLLYEYRLDDCYFHVAMDAAEEYVLNYGTSSYSQAEMIKGEEILNEITYRQKQKELN